MGCAEKKQWCQYVEALEEERKKIQVFQRELPLCLDLVSQAIEAYRRELSGTTTEHVQGRSDCSEQTSSDAPVLEEFIPIKPSGDGETDIEVENREWSSDKRSNCDSIRTTSNKKDVNKEKDLRRKSNWLRSVQLWNQSPDPSPPTHKQEVPRKAVVTEVKRDGTRGAFQPFQREKGETWSGDGRKNDNGGEPSLNDKPAAPSCSAVATSSSAETVASRGGTSRKKDKGADGQMKRRRCWSPELHRRFLHALQQLGGSHAATPKQIRELMKVDGLTNDEVKSHLQKYRLHTRRPSPAIHDSSIPQAPQFVVVGGIWVPPPEFGAVATTVTDAASNGVYAPVAGTSSSPQLQSANATSIVAQKGEQLRMQQVLEEEGSESEGGHVLRESPATSSSTRTTTSLVK